MYVVIIYTWGKAQLPFHIPKDGEKNEQRNKQTEKKKKKEETRTRSKATRSVRDTMQG